jgi:hypothetical protein
MLVVIRKFILYEKEAQDKGTIPERGTVTVPAYQ